MKNHANAVVLYMSANLMAQLGLQLSCACGAKLLLPLSFEHAFPLQPLQRSSAQGDAFIWGVSTEVAKIRDRFICNIRNT